MRRHAPELHLLLSVGIARRAITTIQREDEVLAYLKTKALHIGCFAEQDDH